MTDVDALEDLILAAVADLEGDEPGSLPDTRAAVSHLADRARGWTVLHREEQARSADRLRNALVVRVEELKAASSLNESRVKEILDDSLRTHNEALVAREDDA